MRHRDPDEALEKCSSAVKDWSGGTRIGDTLSEFNRLWSRRVLGQGAMVLLITDGLERDDVAGLCDEMDGCKKSCRRRVWLNPFLRFDGFERRARGVRAMLPYDHESRRPKSQRAIRSLRRRWCRAGPRPSIRGFGLAVCARRDHTSGGEISPWPIPPHSTKPASR